MKETLQIPTPEMLENLIGKDLYNVWTSLCQLIEQKYNMEQLWNYGGKAWKYEYKYRRGGKTLCALYAREQTFGFMVILGKDERAKFESQRTLFSHETLKIYDEADTDMLSDTSGLSKYHFRRVFQTVSGESRQAIRQSLVLPKFSLYATKQ